MPIQTPEIRVGIEYCNCLVKHSFCSWENDAEELTQEFTHLLHTFYHELPIEMFNSSFILWFWLKLLLLLSDFEEWEPNKQSQRKELSQSVSATLSLFPLLDVESWHFHFFWVFLLSCNCVPRLSHTVTTLFHPPTSNYFSLPSAVDSVYYYF